MKCDHCNRCSRVPCAYAGARRAATMPSTPLAAAPAERARKRRRLTDLFMECLPAPPSLAGRGGILARAPPGTGSARQAASHPALEARVEQIAEPVADQVDAEHHREDREAGEQGQPPAGGEVVASLVEHRAPAWRRGRDAEAEEGERGLGNDHASD